MTKVKVTPEERRRARAVRDLAVFESFMRGAMADKPELFELVRGSAVGLANTCRHSKTDAIGLAWAVLILDADGLLVDLDRGAAE